MASTPQSQTAAPDMPRSSSGGVIAQAKGQAGKLADLGIAKAAEFADGKKQDAVGQVDAVVDVVRQFADAAEQRFGPGVGNVVSQGSERLEAIARDLEARSVEDIVAQGRDTIVKHPGAALAVAALAGFAGGRVLKGAMARSAQAQARTATNSKREGSKA